MTDVECKGNSLGHSGDQQVVLSDPDIIRRVEVMCGLFELAYEMKFLALKRNHPEASNDWLHREALRLIEAGTR